MATFVLKSLSLVRLHLEYCSPAWSPHYQKDKQLLEKVQHRFMRLFPDLKKLCYKDRLQRLGFWSLEEHHNRADLLEVFKLKSGLHNISLETFSERSVDSRTRGNSWVGVFCGMRIAECGIRTTYNLRKFWCGMFRKLYVVRIPHSAKYCFTICKAKQDRHKQNVIVCALSPM